MTTANKKPTNVSADELAEFEADTAIALAVSATIWPDTFEKFVAYASRGAYTLVNDNEDKTDAKGKKLPIADDVSRFLDKVIKEAETKKKISLAGAATDNKYSEFRAGVKLGMSDLPAESILANVRVACATVKPAKAVYTAMVDVARQQVKKENIAKAFTLAKIKEIATKKPGKKASDPTLLGIYEKCSELLTPTLTGDEALDTDDGSDDFKFRQKIVAAIATIAKDLKIAMEKAKEKEAADAKEIERAKVAEEKALVYAGFQTTSPTPRKRK